jgi:hypothetical protein
MLGNSKGIFGSSSAPPNKGGVAGGAVGAVGAGAGW